MSQKSYISLAANQDPAFSIQLVLADFQSRGWIDRFAVETTSFGSIRVEAEGAHPIGAFEPDDEKANNG